MNSLNYWTPLSSQVEELAKTVSFKLPLNHKETNGQKWRSNKTKQIRKQDTKGVSLTVNQIKQGIMDGTIESACSDTGASSTAGKQTDPFKETNQISRKIFVLPTGGQAPASKKTKLLFNVRAPANEVDIVPGLQQTLLSTSKFTDAGYTAVYDENEVNFYNKEDVIITAESVLRGYKCPRSKLWRVPLKPLIVNENEDTLILDSACGQFSKNK